MPNQTEILNAGCYLLIRLATTTSSDHVLSQMADLRQHIAFGHISREEATRRAEEMVSGARLCDVVNPLLADIQERQKAIAPISGEFLKIVEKASDKIMAHQFPRNDESDTGFAEALRLIDDLDQRREKLVRTLKGVNRLKARMFMRAVVIAMYSPDSRQEIKLAADQFAATYKEITNAIIGCLRQHESIKQDANRFCQHS